MRAARTLLAVTSLILATSPLAHAGQELLDAIVAGDLEQVELLLNDTSVHFVDENGMTPLATAARAGKFSITDLLLKNGAHANLPSNGGMTPPMYAAMAGKVEVVRVLIKNGAELEVRNDQNLTALMFAARYSPHNVWRVLLKAGIDLSARDTKGNTAMMFAAYSGNQMAVRVLMDNSANIEDESYSGDTALMWASRGGKEAIVELLIEKGANVNHVADGGRTALMLAAAGGYTEVVKFLLASGADREARTAEGATAKTLAKINGRDDVVAMIQFDEAVLHNYGEPDPRADNHKAIAATKPTNGVEVEGNRTTLHGSLSASSFRTSTGEVFEVAALDGTVHAVDEVTRRVMEVEGGMSLQQFLVRAAQSGIEPEKLDENLYRIGSMLFSVFAFRDGRLIGFVPLSQFR